MSRLASTLVLSSVCLVLAGCPGTLTPPIDGGQDAGAPPTDAPRSDGAMDAPLPDAALVDAPADAGAADTAATDTGFGDDAPVSPIDAPDLDAGAPVDAPTPVDAPMPVDAPSPPDAPPFCGDGIVNGTDECDMAALGGATCVSLGFTAGTLSCAGDCTHEVGACTTCGDGTIETGETCDGAMLGSATCVSQGFADGTLACAAGCTAFDTSMCNRCGDNIARNGETCDGTDLMSQTCATRGFLSGTLRCDPACDAFDTAMCTNARAPAATGELLVTEVMPNPTAVGDATGEWFEVVNRTGALLSLTGCIVSDNQAVPATFTITGALEVAAGDILTFAKSASPGFTPSYVYPSGWDLANTGDEVRITCGGTIIDSIVYTTAFPFAAGVAMSLDPARAAAGSNDAASDWCAATTTYGAGATPDRGTPGALNPACPVPPVEDCTNGTDDDGDTLVDCADTADCASAPSCVPLTIGFCRLHFDTTMSVAAGTTTPLVFGRVFVAGLTELTAMNDLDSRLVAAVGRGPDGSDPASAAGWVWTAATPNPGYPGPGAEMNNDEYQASFTAPGVAGSYDYAYRFSGDGGATWTFCDTNAGAGSDGSQDGYQPANAGALTVTGAPTRDVFFSEYVEGSSNNKALEIYNGRGAALDLSTCSIELYSNGSVTATPLALTGSLASGGTYVVCHGLAGAVLVPFCDLVGPSGGAMAFNGDDAIALRCGGTILDVIGQIGVDPGAEWGTGSTSTADNTMRRLCSVLAGDADGADGFTPATEWSGFAADTFADLGTYTCP